MTDLELRRSAVITEDYVGYLQRPIPCKLDDVVRSFLAAFVEALPLERRRVSGQRDHTLSRILFVFAERMACLAVRESSVEQLTSGLMSLAAEGWTEDSRSDMMALGLLCDAAVRIGADPIALVQQIRPYASRSIADTIEEFIKRKPEDRSIGSVGGYVTEIAADGFRYRRTW
jgi:hypothetical protein